MKDRLLPFAISFTVTCLFFINVCNWLFDCGCQSLWAGADVLCNVHLANARHCPICSRGIPGYAGVMAAVTMPQLAASMWLPSRAIIRVLVCLLAFPVGMAIVGAFLGVYDGYWK